MGTVTFEKAFSTPPVVTIAVVCLNGFNAGDARPVGTIADITESGFTWFIDNPNNRMYTCGLEWIAVT